MTRRTTAELQAVLSTGHLAGFDEHHYLRDVVDSVVDLDTYEENIASGNPLFVEQVLWTLTGADMDDDTDQAFTKRGTFSNFLITKIRVVNASVDLDTAAGGIYEAAEKGGTAIVADSQAYSALTAATLGTDLTITAHGLDVLSAEALYLSLTTPQGAAATADVYVIGIPLS